MKKYTKIGIICLLAVGFILLFAGCSLGGPDLTPGTIGVKNINLNESEIYMAPRGRYETYTLQITISPENATNKSVTITLQNSSDADFLKIESNGELTALNVKGEVNNQGVFVPSPINVIIKSVSNPKVTKLAVIYIEETAITGFKFNPKEKHFIKGDSPWQLVPIYVPRHAVIGVENIRFESLNPSFATVDSISGLITPSATQVGNTTIKVTTTASGNDVLATFDVKVKYEAPNWSLTTGPDTSYLFKQIVNYTEEIPFQIFTNQSRADDLPTIVWRVDSIPQIGQNTQAFNYTPDDERRGTHIVSVYIEDSLGQSQLITSQNIEIYEPLLAQNVSITSEFIAPMSVRDNVSLQVTITPDHYPPDSIDWYLFNEDTQTIDADLGFSSIEDNYAFSFQIPKAGRFTVQANCAVYLNSIIGLQNPPVTKRTNTIIEVAARPEGNDIQNVYIEGIKHNTEYLAFVAWDAPATNSMYTIEINKGGIITTMTSIDAAFSDYFYYNGFAVPSDVASLDETFKARVKGSVYGYTDEVEYIENTITSILYPFLDVIDTTLNFNSYVANMRELGKIINYLHAFNPSNFYIPPSGSETRDGYKVNIYLPFAYSDLNNDYYLAGSPADYNGSNYSASQLNAFRLISGANNAYGESGKYAFNYAIKADNSIDVTFYFNAQQSLVNNTTQARQEKTIIPYYTDTPRPSNYNNFATNVGQAISVSTSNQLYLAASWGLKPVPVSGSAAEIIYDAAKDVLRRIIDNGMSEPEKILAIYDFLSYEVLYDGELLALSGLPQQSQPQDLHYYEGFYLEGVFLRGNAVCDGIAKAFTLLSYMEGIGAYKISGTSNAVGHAWNKVLADGKWYAVDATWSSIGYASIGSIVDTEITTRRYLLVTDDRLSSSHFPMGEYPATESTELGLDVYYNRPVGNPQFDHYINNVTEFERLYAYYANIVATDINITELYVEIKFDFAIDYASVSSFFGSVNVGTTFNWVGMYNYGIVYIIVL